MITSYDWLFLSDIINFKPKIDAQHLGVYNRYYGYLDNNKQCYVAPERWSSPDNTLEPDTDSLKAMDIFSMACVVYQILMRDNKKPIFDLKTQ